MSTLILHGLLSVSKETSMKGGEKRGSQKYLIKTSSYTYEKKKQRLTRTSRRVHFLLSFFFELTLEIFEGVGERWGR
jgi:hypothetical protein